MRHCVSKSFGECLTTRVQKSPASVVVMLAALAASTAAVAAAEIASPSAEQAATSKEPPQKENGATASTPSANTGDAGSGQDGSAQQTPQTFDIDEYRVEGAKALSQEEVEEAVYPYLGPGRSSKDIEQARAALEKAYHDKGFQAANVAIRYQNVQDHYVALTVSELKVGQVRVKNSKYHDLQAIKDDAPSLAPGVLPDFGAVTKDIVDLNQWPDRRVTPSLRAGITPGTVDVDLNVDDKLPLHASVELNNRQSPNTTDLRLSTTVSYGNLWQLGHSLSFTYQTAPERQDDMQAFSASYLARIPGVSWLSLLVYGVDSTSDVALLGDMNVVGPGQIIGARAVMTLPPKENFFHTLSVGLDYKHFDQTVNLASDSLSSPISYVPVVATYSASWQQPEKSQTQLDATVTYGLRGVGSQSETDWDNKRFKATQNFFILSGDLSETYELPKGFQLFGKVGGQVADQPLVSSEEYSLGGDQTVRGYLESSWLGDIGTAGTLELRTPNIGAYLQTDLEKSGRALKDRKVFNDWRLFTFLDAGAASIYHPLPDQEAATRFWSYGVGTTFKAFDYLNGSVTLALPQTNSETIKAGEPRVLFRVSGEF